MNQAAGCGSFCGASESELESQVVQVQMGDAGIWTKGRHSLTLLLGLGPYHGTWMAAQAFQQGSTPLTFG